MQRQNLNEFDNQIKALLADAEVAPSRDAWKAISARLDASAPVQAAPARQGRPFAWAGAALAFACVAAAAFLMWPGSGSSPAQEPTTTPVLASVNTVITPETIGPEVKIEEYVREGMLPKRTSANAKRMLEGASAEVLNPAGLSERRASGSADMLEGPSSDEPARTARTVISEADPFAALIAEDNRARKNPSSPSFYAQGLIGGNSTNGTFRAPGTMFAPGEGSGGITELSNSSFGVPFSVGLGVRLYFLPKLSVGTGVDYTLLTRTFTGEYEDYAGSFMHSLQYVGIPLNVYFDVISSERIKFYLHAGGEVELCVGNRYTGHSTPRIVINEDVKKLQYSVGAGLGVEFTLTKKLGLYIDPGFRYYFYNSQPKSLRTEKPLFINFTTGLRFSF